jgi:hypothetical protein
MIIKLFTYSTDFLRNKGSSNVQSGRGSACLTPSVTSADNNNVEIIFSWLIVDINVEVMTLFRIKKRSAR